MTDTKMIEINEKHVLKQAIDVFGIDMQLNVAVEELSELTKEICKYKRGNENLSNIIEEMADCYIMLDQMGIMFELGSTVIEDKIHEKIERLYKRIEKCNNERID